MRTRSIIIIGFVILFTIFGMSNFIQWEYSQEIMDVSEYHRNMSIPAITIIQQIKLDFQMMHMTNMQIIKMKPIEENMQELEEKYWQSKNSLEQNIQKYDDLSFIKNLNGKFLASDMMQSQMLQYVILYKQIIQEHDSVFQQCLEGTIDERNAIFLLEESEIEFHRIIEENLKMEIEGMEKIQDEIIIIENEIQKMIIIFSSVTLILGILGILFISRFVSNPISNLIKMTKSISKGETIETNHDSKNSDVNDILMSLRKMSNELEDYKRKIIMQEKLSSIGELGSRLAHDIRNPLTVIKGTLDVIKMENQNLTDEDKRRFERVDDSVYRIAHQIDNVLDFIKEKPLKLSTYSLNEIINSALKDLPNSENIKIENNSTNIQIECDYEAIKVVIINLLINSIQELRGQGEIKISSKSIDNKNIIEIQDSGRGIPEESLKKIFEPLFTTKQEGTGLGLCSCKSLVEKHGGTISVKNNPTRFIIELPNGKSD